MTLPSFFFSIWAGLACVAALAGAASAQQRPPAGPILVTGTADVDPARYDWLSDEGRRALQGAVDARKAGTLAAFVFAGAPGGNFWTYRFAAKTSDPYSVADLARQALQSCEYLANANCYIVSINGKEARDETSSMPLQPRQLVRPSATFDPSAIPFMSRDEQMVMKGYGLETKPRAMFITSNRGGVWRVGDNTAQAIANTLAECQKIYMSQVCLIYAVNDRVVFAPGGPY